MLYKVCLMLHVMCRIYVYNADLYQCKKLVLLFTAIMEQFIGQLGQHELRPIWMYYDKTFKWSSRKIFKLAVPIG